MAGQALDPLLRMLSKIIPRQRLSPRPVWKSRTPPTASAPPPIQRPQQAKGPNPNIQNQLCNRREADCHMDLEQNMSLGAFQHKDVSFPGAASDHRHEAVRLCIKTHFPAEGRRAPGAARLHCPTVCLHFIKPKPHHHTIASQRRHCVTHPQLLITLWPSCRTLPGRKRGHENLGGVEAPCPLLYLSPSSSLPAEVRVLSTSCHTNACPFYIFVQPGPSA